MISRENKILSLYREFVGVVYRIWFSCFSQTTQYTECKYNALSCEQMILGSIEEGWRQKQRQRL